MLQRTAVLLALVLVGGRAEEDAATVTQAPSALATLGALYRQARSEHYYSGGQAAGIRYSDESAGVVPRAADSLDRDSAYFESRCITCDPNKAAAVVQAERERDTYQGRWRQRGKYDYYNDDLEERRYRDRYDGYYDRARTPSYEYDRYDPYGRNDLFRPAMYNDRYDPYERDRYYTRPGDRPVERPVDRPLIDRPAERPIDRPLMERPYDRNYERGYDSVDARYPYDDQRYDPYAAAPAPPPPARRPYDEYGPTRYNANRGRYDPRYDRYDPYDPYDRNTYRRPTMPYDDRYDRYGGRQPDSRTYYGGSWSSHSGATDNPRYASNWNYAGSSRDGWRDVNRDRERERDRDRDRDNGYYRPRDYFYDSTAAPGGSRGTSYLYDRPESSTLKPDVERDKPTNSPQTQDSNKNYKD